MFRFTHKCLCFIVIVCAFQIFIVVHEVKKKGQYPVYLGSSRVVWDDIKKVGNWRNDAFKFVQDAVEPSRISVQERYWIDDKMFEHDGKENPEIPWESGHLSVFIRYRVSDVPTRHKTATGMSCPQQSLDLCCGKMIYRIHGNFSGHVDEAVKKFYQLFGFHIIRHLPFGVRQLKNIRIEKNMQILLVNLPTQVCFSTCFECMNLRILRFPSLAT